MPIYLFTGDESYLLEQAVKALRAEVLQPETAALAHKVLNKPSIETLVETLGTVSFNLWGATLFEVEGFSFLEKAASDAEKKRLESLKEVLTGLDESKHVLFRAPKIDRKIQFCKWLTQLPGVAFKEFKRFEFWKTEEVEAFVLREARDRAMPISREAARLIVENMGVELQPLMNELVKLSTYTNGREIQANDVKLLSNHQDNTFKMLEKWVQGGQGQAVFEILEEILLKQHPVQLFALTQNHLGAIFRLRLWKSLGVTEAEMAERLKRHPYRVKKDLADYGRVPLERLQSLRKLALDLEYQMKSGQLQDRLAFELLMGA